MALYLEVRDVNDVFNLQMPLLDPGPNFCVPKVNHLKSHISRSLIIFLQSRSGAPTIITKFERL